MASSSSSTAQMSSTHPVDNLENSLPHGARPPQIPPDEVSILDSHVGKKVDGGSAAQRIQPQYPVSGRLMRWTRLFPNESLEIEAVSSERRSRLGAHALDGALSPSPRSLHVLAARGDSLYIFGGYNGTERVNDLHRFSLSTGEWEIVSAGDEGSPRLGIGTADAFSKTICIYGEASMEIGASMTCGPFPLTR